VFFSNLISAADSKDAYYEPKKCIWPDSTFLKGVHLYNLLKGTEEAALRRTFSIVLSSSLARKINFGNQEAWVRQ